jgi:hypothetical protein
MWVDATLLGDEPSLILERAEALDWSWVVFDPFVIRRG